MVNDMGLADSTEFSRMAEEITRIALSSPNPGEIIGKYQQNPDTKLAAFLANGMVQAKLGAKNRQQDLQGYNPNTPTVLDQLSQPGNQGVAGLPLPDGMFNPEMHQQGMAGGGVIAFAEGGDADTLKQISWGETRGRNVVNPDSGASGPRQMISSTFDLLQKKYPSLLSGVSWDDYKRDSKVQDLADQALLDDQKQTLKNLGIPATTENHAVTWFGGPRLVKAPENARMEDVFKQKELDQNPWVKGKTVGEVKAKIINQMGSPSPSAPAPTPTKTLRSPVDAFSPEDEAIGQAYEDARAWRRNLASRPPKDLSKRSQWEAEVAAAKAAEEKAQAEWEGTQNYVSANKPANPLTYLSGRGVEGEGKSPEYFAAKQEALQANPPAGYNALDYGAGIPSLVPTTNKTPTAKPVAPSIPEQYAENTAPKSAASAPAAPTEDNTWMRDAGLAMIRGGLGTMASRNPTRGFAGALQSFGEGNIPAIESFAKMRQAREEAAAKHGEKISDRLLKAQEIASNQVKNAITLQLGLMKQDLPGFESPEARSALAHATVITSLPDHTRKLAGYTDSDVKRARQVMENARAGGNLISGDTLPPPPPAIKAIHDRYNPTPAQP